MIARATIRPGHVQPLWAGHPWVFKQAIQAVQGSPEPGSVVEVVDPKGNVLGAGFYSPASAIPIRLAAKSAEELLAPSWQSTWLARKLETALQWRKTWLGLPSDHTDGFRWVHAEGDGLPGLTVDVYGSSVVVQFLTLGMKQREQEVFYEVKRLMRASRVFESASVSSQKLERFVAETRLVEGEPAHALQFRELGVDYEIEFGAQVQKTGYYFDQRDNRSLVQSLARGKRVLDAYCYVGGFAMAAARGGASQVVAIDSSVQAVTQGGMVARHNRLPDVVEFVRADVPRELQRMATAREWFDLVVLDPPKFAPTVRHVPQSVKMYRRVNALGMRLCTPGGVLVTSSCSAALQPDMFLRMLSMAAVDAGRTVRLLSLRGAGLDHPSPPSFPQGRYLKCAVVQVE